MTHVTTTSATPPRFIVLLSAVSFLSVFARADDAAVLACWRARQAAIRSALERVSPCIVRIDTIGGLRPAPGREDRQSADLLTPPDGPTTGLVYDADGLIITSSFNFVHEPAVITVTLSDGRRLVARLIARDYAARLALLSVDASDLPVPEWLPRRELRVGQTLIAAGMGWGTPRPAVAVGTASALHRMSDLAIQTDARISPVHYGGPLFDLHGRVAGICVPLAPGEDQLAGTRWYDSGIAFAIPPDQLQWRVERLRAGRDLRRGLLGIRVEQRLLPDESATQPAVACGLYVSDVPGGTARDAGLRAGDMISHLDEHPVRRLVDLNRLLMRHAAGDRVRLTFLRGGDSYTVDIRLVPAGDL